MSEVLSDRSNGVDMVNHPPHYASIVPGVECIEIAREYPFNCGNAIKYIWRAGSKGEEGLEVRQKEIEDLKKAIFYFNNELSRPCTEAKRYDHKFGWVPKSNATKVLNHFKDFRGTALEHMLNITVENWTVEGEHIKSEYIVSQIELARDAVQREINRLENVD